MPNDGRSILGSQLLLEFDRRHVGVECELTLVLIDCVEQLERTVGLELRAANLIDLLKEQARAIPPCCTAEFANHAHFATGWNVGEAQG